MQNVTQCEIVIVGTTSSGKSSLANVLTGRYLFPLGVQETTTVSTSSEISADNRNYYLILESNDSTHHLLSKHEKDHTLRAAIDSFMVNHKGHAHQTLIVELPKFGNWVSRIKQHARQMRVRHNPIASTILHKSDLVIIKDSPGLKSTQDSHNALAIRQALQENDIILYVFNSEETDHKKEHMLLTMVAEYVHQSYNGPKNPTVMFVMNRVDAFLRDNDPQTALARAIAERTRAIHHIFNGTYLAANNAPIYPISTAPMFFAEMVLWHEKQLTDKEQQYFYKQLSIWASKMLNTDSVNSLPRSAQQWNMREKIYVYKAIRQASGFTLFIEALAKIKQTKIMKK